MGTETLSHKAELQQKTASEVWIRTLRTISKSRPETIRLLPQVLVLRISLKDKKGGGERQIRQRQRRLRNKFLSFWRGIFRIWKLHFAHMSEILGETEVLRCLESCSRLRPLSLERSCSELCFLFCSFSLFGGTADLIRVFVWVYKCGGMQLTGAAYLALK